MEKYYITYFVRGKKYTGRLRSQVPMVGDHVMFKDRELKVVGRLWDEEQKNLETPEVRVYLRRMPSFKMKPK